MRSDEAREVDLKDCTIGLVLVDHGSRKDAANEMLAEVVEVFKKVSGYSIVEPAHMELVDPTIDQAFGACVAQGATLVVIHPYFLSPGRHSTADIPEMAAQAARHHPGIRYEVTKHLGVDEKIARLIMERVQECLKSSDAVPPFPASHRTGIPETTVNLH